MTRAAILMVDDEEELVSAVAQRLVLRGYDVETVTNGADALQRLRERRFGVVLVDLKMPGIGGLEIMAKARRMQPDLPVVLFTGHGSEADAEQGLRNGAVAYILKPISLDTLMETIQSAVESTGDQES